MGVAKIKFTQGVTTAPAGQALIGTTGTPVVVSNGDDTDIKEWQFEWIDTGSGTSSIPRGVAQDGTLATYTFTPDTTGCYLMHLTTRDKAGIVAEDYRVFGVNQTSGRLIPSFAAAGDAMNFGGQTEGWAPYVNAYLRQVDAGGGGATPSGTGWAHYTAGALDPAAVTAGDTAIVSGALRIASLGSLAAIAVATALTFGANPASTAWIRAANNTTVSAARNFANTGDIPLLGTDGSNNINLGDTAAAQGALTVINGTTGISLKSAGVQIGSLAAASGDFIRFGSGGTAVSSTGYIRTQSGQVDQTVISARNPANALDVPIVSYQGSILIFGGTDGGNTSTFIDARLRGSQVTLENTTMQLSLVLGQMRTAFASSTLAFNAAFHGNNPFVFDSSDNSVTQWNFNINSVLLASFSTSQFTTKTGLIRKLVTKATSYALTAADDVVIFTASGQTGTLPNSPTVGQKHTIGIDITGAANTFAITFGTANKIFWRGTVQTTLTFTTTSSTDSVATFMWDGTVWIGAPGY